MEKVIAQLLPEEAVPFLSYAVSAERGASEYVQYNASKTR